MSLPKPSGHAADVTHEIGEVLFSGPAIEACQNPAG